MVHFANARGIGHAGDHELTVLGALKPPSGIVQVGINQVRTGQGLVVIVVVGDGRVAFLGRLDFDLERKDCR